MITLIFSMTATMNVHFKKIVKISVFLFDE